MKIKIAVIQFPGSNTERETFIALQRVGMDGEAFLWNQSTAQLAQYDGYIIVGGFAYEDRSRAGIIAALDPLMTVLWQQSEQGKPILGICNGAQILVESGLVPGVKNKKVAIALTDNRRIANGQIIGTGYYNVWVHFKRGQNCQPNAFNYYWTEGNKITAPIAHAEGRFMMPPTLLERLKQNGQIALQYCDANGHVEEDFPTNPNGSMFAIAAVSNVTGNVMAMMPHPERTVNGKIIFASMRHYIEQTNKAAPHYLDYHNPEYTIRRYQSPSKALIFTVRLIITDNHAASVAMALLQSRGIVVNIQRQIYWEVTLHPDACTETVKAAIISSNELWNSNKETTDPIRPITVTQHCSLLVLAHDDTLGQQKRQLLSHHFGINGIEKIRHGILWHISDQSENNTLCQQVIDSHILFNQHSHDCYYYSLSPTD